MTHDIGRHGLAQRYLIQALHLAEAASDRALMAETLAAMSQQTTYMNEPQEGIDLARGARALAEREGLSALVAETSVMEAHGHARAGDAVACAAALSAAEVALDQADRSGDPHWIGYFDEAYLSAKFGHCFRELNDHKNAVRFAERSLEMNQGYARGRVFNLTLLAHTHAQSGNIDAACAVGQDAAAAAADIQVAPSGSPPEGFPPGHRRGRSVCPGRRFGRRPDPRAQRCVAFLAVSSLSATTEAAPTTSPDRTSREASAMLTQRTSTASLTSMAAPVG